MGFRFLHLADCHLETSFGGRPETRERLRRATREAFKRAFDYAIEEHLHGDIRMLMEALQGLFHQLAGGREPEHLS